MYGVFDDFLRVPTWHTKHPVDEDRFYTALRQVVRRENFYPDNLGEYMDQKRADGELGDLTDEAYDDARAYYVAAAHAVKAYLRTA